MKTSHLVGFLLSLFAAQAAQAVTITWIGGDLVNPTSWHDPDNWDLGRVPAGDDVVIPDMSPDVNVTFSTGGTTITSLTSAEAFTLSAGTLTIDAASTLNSTFALSGTLTGAGDVTVNGAMSWTGGTMSGTGRTIIGLTGSLSISTAGIKNLNRELENHSPNATWTDGQINFNGGTLDNASDGTFTANLAVARTLLNNGGVNAVNNAGTFSQAGATPTVAIAFNNTGTVNVQSGTLTLSAGGTSSGLIDISAGAILLPGAYTLAAGAGLSGAGAFNLSSTVTCTGAVTMGCVVNLTGTLTGAGDATVTGTLNWTGGTMAAGGRTIIAPAGSLSISTTIAKNLNRELENHSPNATWTDGQINFNSGTLSNASDGTFTANLAVARTLLNNGGINAINNAGMFIKAGAFTPTVNIPFNNTGTVDIQAGTLAANAGGTSNGDFDVAASSTLSFSGTHAVNAGASVNGAGTLSVVGGTTTFTDAPTGSGNIAITAGTADFNGTPVVSAGLAVSGGTLGGTGDLTVNGAMSWTSGTMSGAGRTIIGLTGSLSISTAGIKNLNRELENHSPNATWTDGQINFNGGTLDNASDGTFTANLAVARTLLNNGGVNAVNNAGTFSQAGATPTVAIAFNNTGTVNVQSGTLTLSAGGTSSGLIDISAGAILLPGAYTLAAGAGLSGAGAFNLSSTVTCTGAVTMGCVVNLTGTLTGAGDATVTGTLNWTGGTMAAGGRTIIAPAGSLSISTTIAKNLNRELENHSPNATWTDGQINFNSGTLSNASDGTFTANLAVARTLLNNGGINAINNAGMFIKAGAFTPTVNIPFNNTGTVDIQAGTLAANAGGTSNGDFDVAASSTLSFSGTHAVNAGASVNGAGTLSVVGGTTTFTDAPTGSGNIAITAGTADFNGTPVVSAGLAVSGGTLGGTGDLTVNGAMSWTSGTMSGAGRTIIGLTGSLSISTAGIKNLNRELENHSPNATWTDGQINFNGGTLDNASDGTFTANLAVARTLLNNGGINAINNAGMFIKAGAFTPTVNIPFSNTGTVSVNAGTLSVSSTYTQTAGATILNGGNLTKSVTALSIQGGKLMGVGTITGNVDNTGGSVEPGTSPGVLTITGNYTQGAGATLSIELGGLTVGTQYDRLVVSGSASLAGSLALTALTGPPFSYTPTAGDVFQIMTFGSRTGMFSGAACPALAGVLVRVSHSATDVKVKLFPSPAGDADCDGCLSEADTAAMTLALLDPAAYATAYPSCPISNCDVNADTQVNGLDLQGYLNLLLGP